MIPRPRRCSDSARRRFTETKHSGLENCHAGRCCHRAEQEWSASRGRTGQSTCESVRTTAPSTYRFTDTPRDPGISRNPRRVRDLARVLALVCDSSFCAKGPRRTFLRRSRGRRLAGFGQKWREMAGNGRNWQKMARNGSDLAGFGRHLAKVRGRVRHRPVDGSGECVRVQRLGRAPRTDVLDSAAPRRPGRRIRASPTGAP